MGEDGQQKSAKSIERTAKSLLREMRYMVRLRTRALLITLSLVASATAAQTPARDPSARLREVLPADVADRVLARIGDARARQLPAEALENRALKFAAKGVAPADIERSVNEQFQRMADARAALIAGRGSLPAADETEAGAEAMRKGVDGPSVALLARSAPRDRSLAVPLFVIGTLADRGLPANVALQRVLDRLRQKASDADLETMPGDLAAQPGTGGGNRGARDNSPSGGRGRGRVSGRPATAGPPAGVPANGGKKTNPGRNHRPPKPSS